MADDQGNIRIVISYRRQDTPGGAGRLRESLATHFGRENVFLDIDTIPPGVDWVEAIDKTVSGADVLLPLIGLHWLDAKDERGRRRLDDPNDVLRFEIESALKAGLRIIPVQLHGATMPSADDLPESLAAITRRQSIRIDDDDWPYDIQKLVRALETIQRDKTDEARTEQQQQRERAEAEERLRTEQNAARAAEEERRKAEEEARSHAEEETRQADEAKARDRAEKEQRQQSPGVGAPRSDVAAEPTPPAAPVPTADRALKRLITSRRAVIAAICVLPIIVALGALIISNASDDDGGSGGGGTSEPSGDPFPTSSESLLLTHVPASIRESCTRNEEVEASADADVSCTLNDIHADYKLFSSTQALSSWFNNTKEFLDSRQLRPRRLRRLVRTRRRGEQHRTRLLR